MATSKLECFLTFLRQLIETNCSEFCLKHSLSLVVVLSGYSLDLLVSVIMILFRSTAERGSSFEDNLLLASEKGLLVYFSSRPVF